MNPGCGIGHGLPGVHPETPDGRPAVSDFYSLTPKKGFQLPWVDCELQVYLQSKNRIGLEAEKVMRGRIKRRLGS
jgi:hypothetical protein